MEDISVKKERYKKQFKLIAISIIVFIVTTLGIGLSLGLNTNFFKQNAESNALKFANKHNKFTLENTTYTLNDIKIANTLNIGPKEYRVYLNGKSGNSQYIMVLLETKKEEVQLSSWKADFLNYQSQALSGYMLKSQHSNTGPTYVAMELPKDKSLNNVLAINGSVDNGLFFANYNNINDEKSGKENIEYSTTYSISLAHDVAFDNFSGRVNMNNRTYNKYGVPINPILQGTKYAWLYLFTYNGDNVSKNTIFFAIGNTGILTPETKMANAYYSPNESDKVTSNLKFVIK